MTNQTGSCAGVYGRPECMSSTWFAHVTFSDAGEGLLSITSRENRNGSLTGKKNKVQATGIGEKRSEFSGPWRSIIPACSTKT